MPFLLFRRQAIVVDDEVVVGGSISIVVDGPVLTSPGPAVVGDPVPLVPLQFPNTCIIPCGQSNYPSSASGAGPKSQFLTDVVDAYVEAGRATVATLCDEDTEYQKDLKFCIPCAEVYGGSDAAALKKEVINPRFATYIDICARGVLGTSSFSAVPTPTNTAALESIWSSLGSVAAAKGYTAPATDIVIGTTVTTLVPTTLPGGAVSSVTTTYTTMIPNPKYFASSIPSTTSFSPSATSTSSSTEASKPEKSLAWIAGPVVGGVVGLLLIAALIGFFFVRRRRRAQLDEQGVEEATPDLDGTFTKAQLHSDLIVYVPSELQGDRNF
ncbi:hypothetical protein B0T18DRAFT_405463 [Schizothecium vesticola]|uniref:Uncharacterized protein n=1 Tax=Schizothecium vesticola TaxID=314040 RepID=A0AA40K853_9PEZI|nr:hypothetical protein B0T18DRAFT_405463 [Schizothecium vesticola]